MKIHDLAGRQLDLLELITYAAENQGVNMQSPQFNEFLDWADTATERELERAEIAQLTRLVQECVQLPVYTTEQAATWLGMSVRGLHYALANDLLRAHKPGHDLMFTHDELERYASERRYPL